MQAQHKKGLSGPYRDLEDEKRVMDIKELFSDAINGAREDILKEARDFEYVLTEFTIPSSGQVKEKTVVASCQDQIQGMVVNKLQGEIKQKLTMMLGSRDGFLVHLKDSIKVFEPSLPLTPDLQSSVSILPSVCT